MSVVIIPDGLKAKLEGFDEPVEVYTTDGWMIGYICPAKPKKYNFASDGRPASDGVGADLNAGDETTPAHIIDTTSDGK